MSALFAADDAATAENPWIVYHATRVRRERRRALNAQHKTHGNGPWVPFVAITPERIARAAQACR